MDERMPTTQLHPGERRIDENEQYKDGADSAWTNLKKSF